MKLFSFVILFLLSISHNAFSFRITGATSGINAQTGERPARRDLRTLQRSGAQFDLYIQALQMFQATNQKDLLSHYSIAGIHGRPYRSWDGVGGKFEAGYCTHGSTLFPTWHRPYLALYEQVLWNNTQTIAKKYPTSNRARYQAAADSFRIPYWDWASSATIPSALTSVNLTINTPTGSRTITNPLRRYVFRPKVGAPDFPTWETGFSGAPHTNRNSRAQARLTSNAASINDRTYLLLTRQTRYAPFSNSAYVDSRGNRFDSLESIHDTIHVLIGGWMSWVAFSSFDPIFFLHHTNVDRLFAIWQALHPSSYVGSQVTEFGTFTNEPGTTENVNTPLTPFHSNAGKALYTSVNVRSTRSFGYTVPEVRDWGITPAQITANTRRAVKALYDPNNQFSRRDLSPNRRQAAPSPGSSDPNIAITIPPNLQTGPSRTSREWYANIRIDKFALPSARSFFIHFFIDDARTPLPSDPDAWLTAPTFVGSYVVFSDPAMSKGRPVDIYGQIPLTRRLVELYNAAVIPDLEISTLRPFLKQNLQWRAQREDGGEEIPVAELKSLRVSVVSSTVGQLSENGRFAGEVPEFGDLEDVEGITEGKVGGVGGSE